jgi:hypothetical protein
MKMPPAFSSFMLVALKGIILFFSYRQLPFCTGCQDLFFPEKRLRETTLSSVCENDEARIKEVYPPLRRKYF